MQTFKEIEIYSKVITENKIPCKCGRGVAMHPKRDKQICDWCGNYVFRDKKDEFKYRLEVARKKN